MRSTRCRRQHVRRAPHPVPGGGPRQGGAAGRRPLEEAVLAEEKTLADDANRSRRGRASRSPLWGVLGVRRAARGPGRSSCSSTSSTGASRRRGSRRSTCATCPQPPLPPALVGFIWRMGSVGRDDVTATLLDLVNREVVDIERVDGPQDGFFGDDDTAPYRLTLHDERIEELLPYERDLVNLLFHEIAGARTLVLSELKDNWPRANAPSSPRATRPGRRGQEGGRGRGFLDAAADRMAFGRRRRSLSSPPSPPAAAAVFSGCLVVLPRHPGRRRAHRRGARRSSGARRRPRSCTPSTARSSATSRTSAACRRSRRTRSSSGSSSSCTPSCSASPTRSSRR